jgi:hypothetical protein
VVRWQCKRHSRHDIASYVSTSQSHNIPQCLGCVQINVCLQGLAKTRGEDHDLLGLKEFITVGEVMVELVDVLIERGIKVVEIAQLSQGITACRGAEANIGELQEGYPSWSTQVSLQAIVPLLSGALHVE